MLDDVRGQVLVATDGDMAALRARTRPGDCTTGPVFAGSDAVGGADADLIVDGLLIDVKSGAKPATVSQAELHQLLGYLLLDLDDTHHIHSVGLYLTRTGRLVSWTVEQYLAALGAPASLPELRDDLARLVASGVRLDDATS